MRFAIPILGLTPHGGTRVLVEIANELARRGFSVMVVAPNRPITMPYVFDPNISVRLVGPALSNKLLSWAVFLLIIPFYMTTRRVIANHFLTVFPSWIASKLLGASYIYFVQGVEYKVYRGRLYRMLRAISEWTFRRGRMIAANSYLAKELSKYGDVVLTLKLGVSTSFYSTPLSAQAKEFDVVYFLRRDGYKRIDRFDAMLPLLEDKGITVLCVSQDGDLLDSYADRVATCRPNNDHELVEAIDRCRVLLLTSDYEGFSLPPLEGMARGLPPVMFECGGPAAYATHGENSLIVVDDAPGTAVQYIDLLLKNADVYKKLALAGLVTASQFQLSEAIRVFVDYVTSEQPT